VMYPDIKKIQKEFYLSKEEEKILCSSIAPILIVNPTEKCSVAKEEIAPKLSQIGIMLPNSGLFTLLMNELKNPIVSTSGNKNGDPILATEKKVTEQLKNTADYFLHHNMKILFPQDDSIFKYTDNHTIIQRHARGLAPTYLQMKNPKNTTTLSMGASLKSTFTYFPNEYIYFSQYFGDSENIETLNRFKKTVAQFHSLFNCTPCTVLIDQHPLYSSHQLGKEWAKKWNADLISIQHHKAHFCSVLGEHNLFETKEQILGVIWDGMGLGEDQQIWGGEFFIYENQKIIRADHLEYFDWLAHEKMAREPRISLLSLTKDIQQVQSRFSKTELQFFTQLKKKNRLKTSSMGRLFDAVASALDLIDQNSYEAEAAILLENCAKKYDQSKPIDLLEKHQRLSPYLIIQEILKFHKKGVKKNRLAFSFIYTLSKQIFRIAKENKIKTVALSGGVFQNTLLISTISKIAAKEKINLKINCKLPPNDENISFGQFIYLNQIKN
ncbi:MAG: Sua5/YciO/YrdC/YwlC family protein, partial [Flavobacteriaceae bacterium]